MNPIFKTLIISDTLILSGFGFVAPIFAIFITENIKGGNVEVAGLATAIFLITRAIFQLPVGRYVDRVCGEGGKFIIMTAGAFVITLVPFLYLLVRTISQLYLIQILYGLGYALNFPGWSVLYVHYIGKEKEGYDASFYSTLVILGTGITSALGGTIASRYGFNLLFVLVGFFSLAGSIVLLYLRYPKRLLE